MMGVRKNGAREVYRHAVGEVVPAREVHENHFPPPIQLLGSAAFSLTPIISRRLLRRLV